LLMCFRFGDIFRFEELVHLLQLVPHYLESHMHLRIREKTNRKKGVEGGYFSCEMVCQTSVVVETRKVSSADIAYLQF
jgi:hypothetical protein